MQPVTGVVTRYQMDGLSPAVKEAVAIAATPELTTAYKATLFASSAMLDALKVTLPLWWTWALGFNIFTTGNGRYFTDLDFMQRRPFADDAATVTLWVDVATGSDANPGTQALPLKSIYAAVHGRTGNVRVLVKPGLYAGQDGFRDANPTSVNLIVEPWPGTSGPIISSRHLTGVVWTQTAGKTNTYQYSTASVGSVFNADLLNAIGDYTPLALVGSIDAVEAAPGSYYFASGTVYVRPHSAGAPGAGIRVYPALRNAKFFGTGTVWIKGVHFEGGQHPFHLASTAALPAFNSGYFWDCTFKYAAGTTGLNGLNTTGECYSYCKSCRATSNANDGFNYHNITTVPGSIPRAFETDCVGVGNGLATGDTHNGSTMHDGGPVLRLNGTYTGNKNRNVHDINSSRSLNYGCVGGGSFGSTSRIAFAAGTDTGDATLMALVDCRSTGVGDFDIESTPESTIYLTRFNPASPSAKPGSNVIAA